MHVAIATHAERVERERQHCLFTGMEELACLLGGVFAVDLEPVYLILGEVQGLFHFRICEGPQSFLLETDLLESLELFRYPSGEPCLVGGLDSRHLRERLNHGATTK